jgi:hypothetical protein
MIKLSLRERHISQYRGIVELIAENFIGVTHTEAFKFIIRQFGIGRNKFRMISPVLIAIAGFLGSR